MLVKTSPKYRKSQQRTFELVSTSIYTRRRPPRARPRRIELNHFRRRCPNATSLFSTESASPRRSDDVTFRTARRSTPPRGVHVRLPAHGRREAHELFIRRTPLDAGRRSIAHVRPGEPTEKVFASPVKTGHDDTAKARINSTHSPTSRASATMSGGSASSRTLRDSLRRELSFGQDARRAKASCRRNASSERARSSSTRACSGRPSSREYVSLSLAFTHVESEM